MPLQIGIINGRDNGFTREELNFTNGFNLGILMMNVGLNRIDNVREFKYRVIMSNHVLKIFDDNCDFFNTKFVERMKDADWSCNVSKLSKREFKTRMKNLLFDDAEYITTETIRYEEIFAGDE